MYVDDATSQLMELCFAEVESTFDYFRATRHYLERHGKPMAFYSDRLSVFHVQARDRAAGGAGLSQFGRACRALNIDLLCARSPEAKGRVERANGTLQDRLVKERRVRGLNAPAAATPFLPAFMADYNRRFAKPPAVAYDAHRPLRPAISTTSSRCRRHAGSVANSPCTTSGTSTCSPTPSRPGACAEPPWKSARPRTAPSRCTPRAAHWQRFFPKDHAQLAPGAVVEYPHLAGVFTWIAGQQRERDAARLANRKLSGREKQRLRAGQPLRAPCTE